MQIIEIKVDFKYYENSITRTNCLYTVCTIWKTAVYTQYLIN